jgi:hypothetical protein
MRPRRRAAGAALAAVVVAALLPPVQADAAAGPVIAGQRSKPQTPPRTVTLITGDRVTVTSDQHAVVERGPGRARMSFVTSRAGGRLRVIPADALSALNGGRLDPRLFDITGLIEFGYDDKRSAVVPLIVTGAAKDRAGLRTVRAVPGGAAVHVAKSGVAGLWKSLTAEHQKVWLDGKRKPLLKESVPQIGAPDAWAAGFTGTGVKVGVVDTGVDTTHADLAGQVAAYQDFTESDLRDVVGHGTHVAATIASTGAAAGGYKGVAPGARLVAAKVCESAGCPESAIIAGMEWTAQQGVKVINMSLGGPDTPEQDPVEAALEKLTAERGVLFVVAAGNDGADETVGSPGSSDSALTVGAVTKADGLAVFSSRGPRVGDAVIKPDITGPGVEIVAARGKDAVFGVPGETHVTLSGTSMATPHVAGAAAILAQKHPDWTPAQLKSALMGSARSNPAIGVYAQGAGRVDVPHSLAQTVLAETPSVSFGRQLWPHADDQKIVRTITYRNTGAADVTLDLSLSGTLPAGMFTLSATTVSVPAGGTASVTVTPTPGWPAPTPTSAAMSSPQVEASASPRRSPWTRRSRATT